MFLQRLAVLALVGLVGGGYAAARNGPLSARPVLAPAPARTAIAPPHLVAATLAPVHVRVKRSDPVRVERSVPAPVKRSVPARAKRSALHRVDPLESFCRDARRLHATYETRRPPNGSPASVYIAFLAEGARLERGLAQRLGRLRAPDPATAKLRLLAARRLALARALVGAAERRDARAYWAAAAALANAPRGCTG